MAIIHKIPISLATENPLKSDPEQDYACAIKYFNDIFFTLAP